MRAVDCPAARVLGGELDVQLLGDDGKAYQLILAPKAISALQVWIAEASTRLSLGGEGAQVVVRVQPIRSEDGRLGIVMTTTEGRELSFVLDAEARAALRECIEGTEPKPGDGSVH